MQAAWVWAATKDREEPEEIPWIGVPFSTGNYTGWGWGGVTTKPTAKEHMYSVDGSPACAPHGTHVEKVSAEVRWALGLALLGRMGIWACLGMRTSLAGCAASAVRPELLSAPRRGATGAQQFYIILWTCCCFQATTALRLLSHGAWGSRESAGAPENLHGLK